MAINTLLSDVETFIKAPNGIQELRSIFLQLAIMGKLIDQNDGDGQAKSLIDEINEKRAELIKVKSFKTSPKFEKVEIKSVPFSIPSTWAWSTLAQLGQINPRNNVEDEMIEASFLPMATISEKYSISPEPEIKAWIEIKKGFTHLANNDIAVAKITPCFENGKACVLKELSNGVGSGTTELHVFRPLSKTVEPEYIYLFLKSPEFNLKGRDFMTGTAGQKRVSTEYFATSPIPIPPLAEQKRIVAKVDELMALCDQLEAQQQQQANTLIKANTAAIQALLTTSDSKENLTKNWQRLANNFHTLYANTFPMPPGEGRRKKHLVGLENIKELRKVILQLAVTGKLIAQDLNETPSSNLIKSIEIGKKKLIQEKIIGKQSIFPVISDEDKPFVLPNGWSFVRLGQITNRIGSGSTPRGGKSAYVDNGIPFLRSQNIWNEGLKLHDVAYITDEIHEKMSNTKVLPRDILLNITGASLGRCTLIPDDFNEANVSQHVTIIRPTEPETRDYLHLCILSPHTQNMVWGRQVGMAREGLSKKVLEQFEIPLPPLEEQKRIVSKVNQLMNICDQIEQKLISAYGDAEKLIDATIKMLVA